jgi:glyoxylase-like metal-dependent hydrolase (beta-lactamase superfamily II)
VDRVADGVYQVKKGFRAFIVDGDEGVTLVDTGLPGRGELVVDGLKSIGRSVTDVRSIVLTHSHTDHAGSAAYLKRESGAALYASAADAPAVTGRVKAPNPPFLDRTPLQILKPLFGLLPKAEPVELDHEVGADFRLQLPEDLTAFATPGHTPGHTCYLLDRAGGILFVGDAASHKGGKVVRGWFNRPTPDIDGSARALAGLEFAVACFGHADPLTAGAGDAFKRYAETL